MLSQELSARLLAPQWSYNLLDNLDRLETILAVQILMSAQGIDLIDEKMSGLALGSGTRSIHAEFRKHVTALDDDRHMVPDLERATQLVGDGTMAGATNTAASSAHNRCTA